MGLTNFEVVSRFNDGGIEQGNGTIKTRVVDGDTYLIANDWAVVSKNTGSEIIIYNWGQVESAEKIHEVQETVKNLLGEYKSDDQLFVTNDPPANVEMSVSSKQRLDL